MAFQLIVLYHHPEDVAAFDRHYDEIHAPLAAKLPGLRAYTVQRPVAGGGQRPAYHLVAVLTWDDEQAFIAAMSSEEGQAAVADVGEFAGSGVTMTTGPSSSML
ncbi:EthD family reductase [Nonomuraea sp. NPDC049684]|uniref:EthD family reductase n=1 Tax=Nonomuraea sp. NPDC049684 TaxID=3364356 RepID=UPI0037A86BE6